METHTKNWSSQLFLRETNRLERKIQIRNRDHPEKIGTFQRKNKTKGNRNDRKTETLRKIKKSDCYFLFQIQGLGLDKIKVSFGIDSTQALQLATEMIGSILRLHYQRINPGSLLGSTTNASAFLYLIRRRQFLKKKLPGRNFSKVKN